MPYGGKDEDKLEREPENAFLKSKQALNSSSFSSEKDWIYPF